MLFIKMYLCFALFSHSTLKTEISFRNLTRIEFNEKENSFDTEPIDELLLKTVTTHHR